MRDCRVLELPELAGKTIKEAAISELEPQGREILIRFTDDTQLSVEIPEPHALDLILCVEETPDLPIVRYTLAR